jgi:hypothetical protein
LADRRRDIGQVRVVRLKPPDALDAVVEGRLADTAQRIEFLFRPLLVFSAAATRTVPDPPSVQRPPPGWPAGMRSSFD